MECQACERGLICRTYLGMLKYLIIDIFSFFPVLDPIFVCYLAHFKCYPNQMWLPKWFPVVTVWLYVFSVRSLHQLLQQSLCRQEQKGRVKLTRFIHNFPIVSCALLFKHSSRHPYVNLKILTVC